MRARAAPPSASRFALVSGRTAFCRRFQDEFFRLISNSSTFVNGKFGRKKNERKGNHLLCLVEGR